MEVFRISETNIGGWATQTRVVGDHKSKNRTKPSIFGAYIFLSHRQMALCTCVISKERETHPLLHVQELNSLSNEKNSNAICLGAAFIYGMCSRYLVVYPHVRLLKNKKKKDIHPRWDFASQVVPGTQWVLDPHSNYHQKNARSKRHESLIIWKAGMRTWLKPDVNQKKVLWDPKQNVESALKTILLLQTWGIFYKQQTKD